MTLPASGPLSLGGSASNSINNEFGYGSNLGAYRNKLYTNAAGTTTSAFPFAPNSISFPTGVANTFYNTRKIPAGSVTYAPGSGTFTIPPYNTITFNVLAGGGGGGGGGGGSGGGGCPGDNGTSGTSGASSSLTASGWSGYTAAAGGAGGGGCGTGCSSSGSNGTSYNGGNGGAAGAAGNGGGHAGGSGGAGQLINVTLTNPLLGGSGLSTGVVINYSVGGGGPKGGGGVGKNANALGQCYNDGGVYGGDGGAGGNGSITISWS